MNNFKKTFVAKKSLGQNFLHAPQVISAMIHAGESKEGETILEIGPGKGVLTLGILTTGARVIAVEKDDRVIPFLNDKFAMEIRSGQLQIIHGDILTIDLGKELDLKENYKVIANIPYYITGEILRKLLESDSPPTKIVMMLQKEVARRIVDKKESILGISIKAYGEVRYICSVPRKFFRPIPNVDSAVIMIENISKKFFIESGISEQRFFEIVKAGFAHKRKVVRKNLEDKIAPEIVTEIWEKENIPKNARAEEITLIMWKKILGYNRLS